MPSDRVDMAALRCGTTAETGEVIKTIVGRTADFVIFFTPDDRVGYQYNDDAIARLTSGIVEMSKVNAHAYFGLSDAQRKIATKLAANALYRAFLAGSEEGARTAFRDVRRYITVKKTDFARFRFVVAGAATAVVCTGLMLLAYWLGWPEGMRVVYLGALGGITGSAISVLQRTSTLSIDPYSSGDQLALHGVLRSMLGLLFGGFLACAVKGGIVAGALLSNPFALLTWSVIAGFSERLIPDLLHTLEGKAPSGSPTNQPPKKEP